MEFFDSKEEVIEIVLTPFGRYALSQGDWDPQYYAFFDDDIIYDLRWVSGSSPESQNAIEERIQDKTPYMKSPTAFVGIESLTAYQNNEIINAIFNAYGTNNPPFVVQDPVNGIGKIYAQEHLQPHGDKFDFLSNPIGTSELSSEKYPAWQLTMLKGDISSSTNYLESPRRKVNPAITSPSGVKYEQIPQINIDLNYKLYVGKVENPVLLANSQFADYNNITFPVPENSLVSDVGGEIPPEDFENIASQVFDDGTYFMLENGKIIIDLLEPNTRFTKENFEIEVFISGALYNDAYGMPKQLYFAPLDGDITENEVENYLTIRTDRDIELAQREAAFADLQQLLVDSTTTEVVSTRDFIVRDLYAPDEDICE